MHMDQCFATLVLRLIVYYYSLLCYNQVRSPPCHAYMRFEYCSYSLLIPRKPISQSSIQSVLNPLLNELLIGQWICLSVSWMPSSLLPLQCILPYRAFFITPFYPSVDPYYLAFCFSPWNLCFCTLVRMNITLFLYTWAGQTTSWDRTKVHLLNGL